MSDLVGDTTHLHTNKVSFNAVHELRGAERSGHFSLTGSTGLKHLLPPRAFVRILSDSLRCRVNGPSTASIATTVHVAVVPGSQADYPTSAAQILTVGGSATVTDSVYRSTVAELKFAVEASHQIKPKPQVGELPEVVFSYTAEGGDQTTRAYLIISGEIEVDGVGFVKSW